MTAAGSAPGWHRATLTTWGRSRYARTRTRELPPSDGDLVAALRESDGPVIVYGSGRCYGDGALNNGARTLLSRGRARILDLDLAAPSVLAEGGVTFDQLSAALHRHRITYPVSSATGAVTLGGALVNDLHSKNHTAQGSFSRHVRWFDLMLADGSVRRIDREGEPELWRATVGGLGLTGVVLRVAINLLRIPARAVDARYRKIRNLDEFLDAMEPDAIRDPFWFGWVDSLADGRAMGRGILETGRFAPDEAGTSPYPKPTNVPFPLPSILLRPAIVARTNARRWRKLPDHGLSVRKPLEPFYFPLDHIGHFNRIYGRRGFYSPHFGIPHGDPAGVRKLLEAVVQARAGSLASVLKPMGGPGEGYLSFPMRGYAFAVDLPRRPGVEELHKKLERITLDHGGRLYVAKDALMSAQAFARMFPELERFRAVLRRVDPHGRFQSDMSRRLRIRPELAR